MVIVYKRRSHSKHSAYGSANVLIIVIGVNDDVIELVVATAEPDFAVIALHVIVSKSLMDVVHGIIVPGSLAAYNDTQAKLTFI